MYGNEADKLSALRGASQPDDNMSMTVQKIENGFLILTVGNKNGKFFQRTTYVEYDWRLGNEVERLWSDFSAETTEPEKYKLTITPPMPPASTTDDDDVPF